MNSSKKPDGVAWDEENEAYIAKLLPYATSNSSPVISIPNVDAFKQKGVEKVSKQFQAELEDLQNKIKQKINWNFREKQLEKLLSKFRKNNGEYDCLIPGSGGKDSAYQAHILKYKYKMNPLTITWSPLKYTDIGWSNLQSHNNSGLTNMLCSPNGNFQRKLARLCFEELGDAFHVFVLGQISYPFQMACKLGVSLVFYGENGEAEYAGDPEFADRPYKPSSEWVNQHFKGVTFDELLEYGLKNKLIP